MMFDEPLPTDISDCFVCGLPAEVIDAFIHRDDRGIDIRHHRVKCADSHVMWQVIN